MTRCGVELQQLPDGGWRLEFFGAVQWRVYQTGPQHAAKLTHLQSLLSKADRSIIPEVNRLVREVHDRRRLASQCVEQDSSGMERRGIGQQS